MTAFPFQRFVFESLPQVMYGLPSSEGAPHGAVDCPPDGMKEKQASSTFSFPIHTLAASSFRPS